MNTPTRTIPPVSRLNGKTARTEAARRWGNTVPRMPPKPRRPDSQGWAATLWVLAFSAALLVLLIWKGTRT